MVTRSTIYLLALLTLACGAAPQKAFAINNGQYENVDQATRDWVRNLQATISGYVCCSLTDGQILGDQDWKYGKDSYVVYITNPEGRIFTDGSKGKWYTVPESAIINKFPLPRLVLHALVWVFLAVEFDHVHLLPMQCFA